MSPTQRGHTHRAAPVPLQTRRLTQGGVKLGLRGEDLSCREVKDVLLELQLAGEEGFWAQGRNACHLAGGALACKRGGGQAVRGAAPRPPGPPPQPSPAEPNTGRQRDHAGAGCSENQTHTHSPLDRSL